MVSMMLKLTINVIRAIIIVIMMMSFRCFTTKKKSTTINKTTQPHAHQTSQVKQGGQQANVWGKIFCASANEAEMYRNCNNERVRNTHLLFLFLLHYESNNAITEREYNKSLSAYISMRYIGSKQQTQNAISTFAYNA